MGYDLNLNYDGMSSFGQNRIRVRVDTRHDVGYTSNLNLS